MNIITIDPGRSSGWALTEPWLSGQIDHEESARCQWWELTGQHTKAAWKQLPHHERLKRSLACGSYWLEDICRYYLPAVIVIEAQDSWGSIRAMESMLSWRAVYLAVAGRLELNLLEVPVRTWQAGGRKTWAKDDPEADKKSAEAIRAWWLETQAQRVEAA